MTQHDIVRFHFCGQPGTLQHGMVQWGGASFQIEAAAPELRAAIEKARAAAGQPAR